MPRTLAALLVALGLALTGCHDGTNTFAPQPAVAVPTITTAVAPTTDTATTPPPTSDTPTSDPTLAPAVDAEANEVAAPQPAPDPHQPVTLAVDVLGKLPIKGRAPKTGYSRDQFGPAWTDGADVPGGHNGCDTRNDILARDLDGEQFKPGTHDCVVLSGSLDDPYTAQRLGFTRGQDTSGAVQIDHIVALSDAWQKGAQQLTADQRIQLANDPLNLQATDGPTNVQKGDGDAATWLPPARGYRCTYVARQIAVKFKYRLWVTQAEHDAMLGILAECPHEQLPTEAA